MEKLLLSEYTEAMLGFHIRTYCITNMMKFLFQKCFKMRNLHVTTVNNASRERKGTVKNPCRKRKKCCDGFIGDERELGVRSLES
jgi:hypothetical protein